MAGQTKHFVYIVFFMLFRTNSVYIFSQLKLKKITMTTEKTCQFVSSICGNYFMTYDENENPTKEELFLLKNLKEDVGKMFGADIPIRESDLICWRSELPLNLECWICKNHRYKLGTGFRPSTLCKYSEHHKSTAKGTEITWRMYKLSENVTIV